MARKNENFIIPDIYSPSGHHYCNDEKLTLDKYHKKRHFSRTPEPKGRKKATPAAHIFVVQRHDASRLHYDFRLEAEGVLKSWAVPKGPSLNPKDKRLAIQVEDHPVSYAGFEGDIPKGNYGAGRVDIWDQGIYLPVDEDGKEISERSFLARLRKGSVKFRLRGKKLQGSFALIKIKAENDNAWLLIKHNDEFATDKPYNSDSQANASSIRASPLKNRGSITKTPSQVKKSSEKKKASSENIIKSISGKKVTLTNPDKIYFPEDSIAKKEVWEYYDKISRYIMKYLKDRPQSLRRNPNGIHGKGFFHKDAGDEAPDWVETYHDWSEHAQRDIHYILCNNKATLLYLANLGCIEINPWNSKYTRPENPDYLILDLDPSEDNSFDQVIETAQVIRDILSRAGCPAYCKTSGASGLHVYVPLGAKYDYGQARIFAEMIAALTVEQLPECTTLERSLKKRRKNHIYVDFLQNRSGQTLSSAYSLRPRLGAPVSAPLDWKEVKPGIKPEDFHMYNIFERLNKKGDLFNAVLKKGIDMERILKKIS